MDNLKIAWATDIHLNFKQGNTDFYNKILYAGCDAVFITGDIAEAPNVAQYVMEMNDKFKVPMYFVLGNHDYYRGSLEQVRKEISNLTEVERNIMWLPSVGVCELTPETAVIGVDGWYDGRYGKANPPKVIMNDWKIIEELRQFMYNHDLLLEELRTVAQAEADLARIYLKEAASKYDTVFFLTHVPPWAEAAWHMNRHSDKDWAPWFTSKVVGDVLEEVADEFPKVNFEVLAGHTHSSGQFMVKHNLRCRTGRAEYGKPDICEMICVRRR